MNLKDAKDQVEREHPELTAAEKFKAIKALRAQDKAAEKTVTEQAEKEGQWPSVAESWGFVAAVIIGMRALAWAIWDAPFDAPHWYDVLYVALLIYGIVLVSGAYKRRRDPS